MEGNIGPLCSELLFLLGYQTSTDNMLLFRCFVPQYHSDDKHSNNCIRGRKNSMTANSVSFDVLVHAECLEVKLLLDAFNLFIQFERYVLNVWPLTIN